MQKKITFFTLVLATVLAWCVVMLGAYTRLTHAGLGCPDWPGCYGHLVLPQAKQALDAAQNQFPEVTIETKKAWTEMTHRYAAGTLALLIFFMAWQAFYWNEDRSLSPYLALSLVGLVLFQAALGMWTVTLKLLPIVVMGHLLGGILIFSILCCLSARFFMKKNQPLLPHTSFNRWVALGVIIVFCQIALGGWVSANYAGIACIGFPQCNGKWMPALHFAQGFNLFSIPGINYQGGILAHEARETIQFIHRLGAVLTASYLIILSLYGFRFKDYLLRSLALSLILLVLLQFSLGVMNVIYLLPLPIAIAHNGIAALLMATILVMFYSTRWRIPHAN